MDCGSFDAQGTGNLGLEAVFAHKADQTERFPGTARAVDIQFHGLHGVDQRTTGQRWRQ